jgi:hypothetical protein
VLWERELNPDDLTGEAWTNGQELPVARSNDRATLTDGASGCHTSAATGEGVMPSQEGTLAHATSAKALSLKCERGLGGIQGKWTCFPCVIHSNSQLI